MSNNDISWEEYREEINSMADEVERTMEEYPEDYDDEYELIWELIDSHQWVIYSGYHYDVLKHNQAGLGEWEHYVEGYDTITDILQALAFCALREDLYDELFHREVL